MPADLCLTLINQYPLFTGWQLSGWPALTQVTSQRHMVYSRLWLVIWPVILVYLYRAKSYHHHHYLKALYVNGENPTNSSWTNTRPQWRGMKDETSTKARLRVGVSGKWSKRKSSTTRLEGSGTTSWKHTYVSKAGDTCRKVQREREKENKKHN